MDTHIRPRANAEAFRPALLVTLILALAAAPAAAQAGGQDDTGRETEATPRAPVDPESAPRPTTRARHTTGAIALDGRLDEATWADAQEITGFYQSQPNTGHPASERTVVRVLYDADRLYIAAICYDSDPSGIIARSLEQDFETHNDDIFAVTLDTYLDRRNAFMFLVNPNGAIKDGQVFDDSRTFNLAWEGVVEVETAVHDSGWTVEMAIPFTTLRFDPSQGEQSWGLQFLRRIRRKNEDAYWAPLDRRDRIHRMSRAGTLTGLSGLRPGRNLSVKPFALAARTVGGGDPWTDAPVDADAGIDLKWSVTPGLTLDLTYGTDFSQVEVDQEQVNLTRFPLFFPEKRDFFIENAGVFAFGDVSVRNYRSGASPRDFTLFHSRRIGLTGDGRQIPILAGGRLTGQAGGVSVGLLEMQTRGIDGVPAENFAVARARRNVFGSGDVGAIFINRQATGADAAGEYNRSYGADANLRFFDNLIVNSYLVGTDADTDVAATGDATAARVAVGWRDPLWDASAFFKRVGDAFEPGVGFVRRRGMRHTYATVGAHPRPAIPFVQELNPYVQADYITDLGAALETRDIEIGLDVDFLDGGRFGVQYNDRYERLDAPFTVRGDAAVPAGAYGFNTAAVFYRSDASRPLSATIRHTRGGYFNGDRSSLNVGALWRPSPHVSLDLSASRNDITLPDEAVTADVYGGRLSAALSTTLLGSAYVQYNAARDELITNARINFIHAPLSDFFLVYTERRDMATDAVIDRGLTAKVTKMVDF